MSDANRQPTTDEAAGMAWWNGLTKAQRSMALRAAGWEEGGSYTPSAAEAWAWHKKWLTVPASDLAKKFDEYFDALGSNQGDADHD